MKLAFLSGPKARHMEGRDATVTWARAVAWAVYSPLLLHPGANMITRKRQSDWRYYENSCDLAKSQENLKGRPQSEDHT